jgi:hypothetical protein
MMRHTPPRCGGTGRVGRALLGLPGAGLRALLRALEIAVRAATVALALGSAAGAQPRGQATREAAPAAPRPSPHEVRAYNLVAGALVLSIAATATFGAAYALGARTQILAGAAGVSLAALAVAFIVWTSELLQQDQVVEEREPEPSPEEARRAAEAALAHGQREITRRGALGWLLGAALGSLGVAALFPVRSLGPGPDRLLFHTKWRPGALVVGADGKPVGAGDLVTGSVVTVFPEGHVGDASSPALLIRVEPGSLGLPPQRLAWAPEGYVAYSKICTHAGCPVGLYRALNHQLMCPCHQSTFDVLTGAQPVFGPATRPLPHVFLLQALLAALIGVHLFLIWHQKHTQFPGPGRTERTVTGSPLWPTYTMKSVGLGLVVFSVLTLLSGAAQVNPVWLYGPYEAWQASSPAQPDWYLGWTEGALRLWPNWELRVLGRLVANPFFPAVLMPAAAFLLIYLWPWIERTVTGDGRPHHLLTRAREVPGRSAVGAWAVAFGIVLTLAGSNDVIARVLDVPVEVVTVDLRITLGVVPVFVAVLTYFVCRDLRERPPGRPIRAVVRYNARGGYEAEERPAPDVPEGSGGEGAGR